MLPAARYLQRAKDLADARYAEPITVEDLAAAAGLLRYTDRSVADICAMVGLTSVGSFTTTFARVYGRPPAAYRAALPPAAVHARIPSCILARDTRKTAHPEKTGGVPRS
ncbi:helix-turn-helix domain-containing protein [Mycobacterium sp. C31M]